MGFTSLRQRLLVMLLIPVALLVGGMGMIGFFFARDIMLDNWRETALLSLERGAHSIDMSLGRPMDLVRLAEPSRSGREAYLYQEWYVSQLKNLPGVESVHLSQDSDPPVRMAPGSKGSTAIWRGRDFGEEMMMFHQARVSAIGLPHLEPGADHRTVDIKYDLLTEDGKRVGGLNVAMSFDYLLAELQGLGWWKSQSAMLVSDDGHILTGKGRGPIMERHLGQDGRAIEKQVLAELRKHDQGTIMGSGHPPDLVAGFYRLKRTPWSLVLISSGPEVMASIVHFRDYALAMGLASVIMVVVLIILSTHRLVRPIQEVSQRAAQVAQGEYGDPLPDRGRDEVARLVASFNAMVQGLKERDFVRNTFGRYMDPAVARQLISRPEAGRLGGEQREVAIMLSDIRGFTPLCETLSPTETIGVINRYLSGLIAAIQDHQGIIVDFLGDAILAFFDPLEGPCRPAARRAVCCALEMQRVTERFNQREEEQGHPPIQIGIGINLGQVVVGNIGSRQRAKYGIIGAPVNYTHRLQAVAQGGQVIISDYAASCLGPELRISGTRQLELKGVPGLATLHVVDGLADCQPN
jgi:class 3 adenylate cyclase